MPLIRYGHDLLADPDLPMCLYVAGGPQLTTLAKARTQTWDRLAASTDPAERAACQKIIDKLSMAIGILQGARGCLPEMEADAARLAPLPEPAGAPRDLARWMA